MDATGWWGDQRYAVPPGRQDGGEEERRKDRQRGDRGEVEKEGG